jgi:branched-chain amino acid transport system permease protein
MNVSFADIFSSIGVHANPTGTLGDIWRVTVAQIAPIIPYILLILILIFRPTGLLGTRDT